MTVKISELTPVAAIQPHHKFEMVDTDDLTHGPGGSSFSGRFDQIPVPAHDHDGDYAPISHGHTGDQVSYDPSAVPSGSTTVQDGLDDAAFSVPQAGTARVSNIMSCDQATYDGLAPVGDYLYIITG